MIRRSRLSKRLELLHVVWMLQDMPAGCELKPNAAELHVAGLLLCVLKVGLFESSQRVLEIHILVEQLLRCVAVKTYCVQQVSQPMDFDRAAPKALQHASNLQTARSTSGRQGAVQILVDFSKQTREGV